MPEANEIGWKFRKGAEPYETCEDFYYELTLGTDARSVLKKLIKDEVQLEQALCALGIIESLQNALEEAGLWISD